MKRREFDNKVRLAAFKRSGGNCEKCTGHLYAGKFAYDHVLPDWLGGEPVLSNCMVLCSSCHGEKTAREDVPRIAKTKRQRARHIGAETKTGRALPGSRRSPWKQKLNGTWERRS